MEALPRGNEWKLMTTGGAAKAQVLDSCLGCILTNLARLRRATNEILSVGWN